MRKNEKTFTERRSGSEVSFHSCLGGSDFGSVGLGRTHFLRRSEMSKKERSYLVHGLKVLIEEEAWRLQIAEKEKDGKEYTKVLTDFRNKYNGYERAVESLGLNYKEIYNEALAVAMGTKTIG